MTERVLYSKLLDIVKWIYQSLLRICRERSFSGNFIPQEILQFNQLQRRRPLGLTHIFFYKGKHQ